MSKIFFLMGKSASGKDTVYKILTGGGTPALTPYVGYTTRPIREGERDGREYHFSSEAEMSLYEREGRLIEKRVYHTVYGDWYYFSVDDGELDERSGDYLAIGTLESYLKMKEYYGEDKIVPLYIETDDGLRLERAVARERAQENPGYAEVCRRFLSDECDFSEENLKKAGVDKRFYNTDSEKCARQIRDYICRIRGIDV